MIKANVALIDPFHSINDEGSFMKTILWPRALWLGAAILPLCVMASSHREAPLIAGMPREDGTDFYMFRSYEPGRSAYVTLIANYIPLQDAYGGPNYFNLDPNAVYRILVNNDGDAKADLSFEFRFKTTQRNLAVNAGGEQIPVPLINIGPVEAKGANLNVLQTYSIAVVRGGHREWVENDSLGGTTFQKPADNIGKKSIADYEAYAAHFVYDVGIPGCASPGRVFVGQRKDGFVVNLGEVFDLVNTNPGGPRDAEPNTIPDKNVTSIALEVPINCVTRKGDPVIGAWTTASLRVRSEAGEGDHEEDHEGDHKGEHEGEGVRWQQVS